MPEITARTAPLEIDFAPLRDASLAQAREHDLTVLRDDSDGRTLETYYGSVGFLAGAEGARI